MEDILKRLGERIRTVRISRGFGSQEALAAYLKMHRTAVGHLETGRKDFRLTSIIRVAQALEVTLSELFAGVETGESPKSGKRLKSGQMNRQLLLREVAVVEQAMDSLKAIAGEEGGRTQKAGKKK